MPLFLRGRTPPARTLLYFAANPPAAWHAQLMADA